jgi:hypothetical protein
MRGRRAVAFALAAVALAAPGCARRHKPLVPQQDVRMDSDVLDEFLEEIAEYVQLHHRLTGKVPTPEPGWSDQQIADRQRLLTVAIQTARRDKTQGNIFTPEVEAAFRNLLNHEFASANGPAMRHEIHSGNPTSFTLEVNAHHPDESSVPPSLLPHLPALPEQVRYRFVGRHLILSDTDAHVILDFLRDVVPDP